MIRCTASWGTLASMIPELRDYYRIVTGRPSKTHPLQVTSERAPRGLYRFHIGDGEQQPIRTEVEQSFPNSTFSERNGRTLVDVPEADINKVRCCIVEDSRGGLWYIENPFFPLVLPEVGLHFLMINFLSNIMRYSPHGWGAVLTNEVNSGTALLIRRYLSVFENKLPFIVLRDISRFHPSLPSR